MFAVPGFSMVLGLLLSSSVLLNNADLQPVPHPHVAHVLAPRPVLVSSSGADPCVVHDGGELFYTQTTGSEITMRKGRILSDLARVEPVVVWRPGPGEQELSRNIWAPEIHKLDGRWYIYFAADDGMNENHRMYVLESSKGPMGPYRLKGRLAARGEDRWAIDGTVLDYDGNRYFIWSGWPRDKDGRQNLYIAKMKNPWTLEGKRKVISEPEETWESWINEGPQALIRGGRVFLIYSANRSWTDHYRLGMLELVSDDPSRRESWKKNTVPVFEGVPGPTPVVSPGHCSFYEDAGGHDWIVYHVARFPGSGWEREVRAQRMAWTASGEPVFGKPAAPNW